MGRPIEEQVNWLLNGICWGGRPEQHDTTLKRIIKQLSLVFDACSICHFRRRWEEVKQNSKVANNDEYLYKCPFPHQLDRQVIQYFLSWDSPSDSYKPGLFSLRLLTLTVAVCFLNYYYSRSFLSLEVPFLPTQRSSIIPIIGGAFTSTKIIDYSYL
jgi:hypothetical protein